MHLNLNTKSLNNNYLIQHMNTEYEFDATGYFSCLVTLGAI